MNKTYKYKSLINFGANKPNAVDDPISYCMPTTDNYFIHGPQSWKIMTNSKPCQAYLSEYCSQGWDGFCEVVANTSATNIPNQIDINSSFNGINLTSGDILVRNTASKKYLLNMGMCRKKIEQFDPLVSTSPNIYYWENNYGSGNNLTSNCTPEYAVDPSAIDDDIVMNKILLKPSIAPDILDNIYRTMKENGTLVAVKDKKLGKYFEATYGETF